MNFWGGIFNNLCNHPYGENEPLKFISVNENYLCLNGYWVTFFSQGTWGRSTYMHMYILHTKILVSIYKYVYKYILIQIDINNIHFLKLQGRKKKKLFRSFPSVKFTVHLSTKQVISYWLITGHFWVRVMYLTLCTWPMISES